MTARGTRVPPVLRRRSDELRSTGGQTVYGHLWPAGCAVLGVSESLGIVLVLVVPTPAMAALLPGRSQGHCAW